jgi:hypothetical protein
MLLLGRKLSVITENLPKLSPRARCEIYLKSMS